MRGKTNGKRAGLLAVAVTMAPVLNGCQMLQSLMGMPQPGTSQGAAGLASGLILMNQSDLSNLLISNQRLTEENDKFRTARAGEALGKTADRAADAAQAASESTQQGSAVDGAKAGATTGRDAAKEQAKKEEAEAFAKARAEALAEARARVQAATDRAKARAEARAKELFEKERAEALARERAEKEKTRQAALFASVLADPPEPTVVELPEEEPAPLPTLIEIPSPKIEDLVEPEDQLESPSLIAGGSSLYGYQ